MNNGRPQADVGLGQLRAHQILALGQDRLDPVQRAKERHHMLLIYAAEESDWLAWRLMLRADARALTGFLARSKASLASANARFHG